MAARAFSALFRGNPIDNRVSKGLLHLGNVVLHPSSPLRRRCIPSEDPAAAEDEFEPVAVKVPDVKGDEFFLGGRALCVSEEAIFFNTL